MTTDKVIYETGATSHAVNDLILFTDNTRELAELRDKIYNDILNTGWFGTAQKYIRFLNLSGAAKLAYRKEFPQIEDHQHIRNMSKEQTIEYCTLYANDFENWKQEHNTKVS